MSYRPLVSRVKRELWASLEASFRGLLPSDTDRLIGRLADNEVDVGRWRAILDNPAAFQLAIGNLLDQPPFVSFDTHVLMRPNGAFATNLGNFLKGEQVAERFGLPISRPGERPEQILYAMDDVEMRLRKLLDDPAFGSLDRSRVASPGEVLTGNPIRRAGTIHAVPIATLALSTRRETMQAALACEVPHRHGVRDWSDHVIERLLEDGFFWKGERFVPAVRLGMFGFVEVSTLESNAVQAALPEGAEPAGLVELLYAIERYPRILNWLRFAPDGGLRRDCAQICLRGLCFLSGIAGRIPTCDIATDLFLGSPSLAWYGEIEPRLDDGKTALIPYVIPLKTIDPKTLPVERPRP